MNSYPTKAVTPLKKAFSLLMVTCLVFTLFAVAAPGEASAASATFKIKSLKWAKKSADVTLVHKDSVMQIKHTVKLSNNIKGSNCVAVTIQNTKTKAKMTAHTGKNGGSVSFPIENKKTHAGTWKVVSVSAAKRTITKAGYLPGYWDGNGFWHNGYYVYRTNYKNLRTIKVKKPSIKVQRGADMKLTLSSPKSILASETTTTLTATLKTEKGVPVAGETIRFQLTPGKTRGLMSSTNKPVAVTVTTDSKGLAKATVSVPRIPYSDTEFMGYTVTALYKGKAKKYCLTESAPTGVSQIKEKTAFVLAPTWDGHTGTRTFTSKLAVSGGPNDGKVISGVPIEWRFCKSGSVSPYYHSDSNAKTNSEGITSTTWTLQTGNLGGQSDWLDYDVTLFAQSGSMRSTPYAPPAFKTYKLNKKQGIKYYTLDMSKVIERCYDGSASWFTASAAQKIFLRIASTENVFVDINGIPLAESISISSSDPNRFIKCSVGKVVASMMYDEFAADIPLTFSLNAQNRILLGEGSSGTNRIEVPSAYRDATSLQVTLTLPTFEDGIYPEYKYVPINGTVSKTFGE